MEKYKETTFIFTAFIALLLSSCGNARQTQDEADMPQEYSVLELGPQHVSIDTDFPATLQGEEVIEIRPRIEGYLEELYVDEGMTVKRGQRLFRISSPQYEQELRIAEAGIHTAQADVDAAEMAVRKTRPLVEKEIISEFELESAEYTLRSKKAVLAQANATVANARANVGYTIISSPSDGVIGTIPYKKGSLVSSTSTSPLTTLAAAKDVYAYFSMNEKQLLDFNRIFKGNTIQEKLKLLPPVTLVLADGTLYGHSGKLETASGLINTETGTVSFRATFPNPEAMLQSGGSASVRLPRDISNALVIPQSATYELQDKRMVFVVGADNKVSSSAITTIATNDGKYFVVSSGLSEGDNVVLTGLTTLSDSTAIQPVAANPQTVYSNLQKQ